MGRGNQYYNSRPYTIDELKECVVSGLRQSEIAKMYNRSRSSIQRDYKLFGIRLQPGQKHDAPSNNRKVIVGYLSNHARVRLWRGKPKLCFMCGDISAKVYDWANISGWYEDPNDYIRLCRKCHKIYDGLNKNKKTNLKRFMEEWRMAGILEKIRIITLGHIHDLLDETIDMSSPSALRQYVRDLEAALDKMRNEAAIQAGQIRTLNREIGDLQHTIDADSAMVSKILEHGDASTNTIARAKATAIVENKKQLATKQDTLEAQKKTSAAIDDAVSRLDAKHTLMVNQVRELERIDRDSKAKEQAAASLEQAGKLVGNGASISIDDIKGKMNARNDVASEKFDRAMGAIQDGDESNGADSTEVDELLNSLKPAGK